MRLLLLTLPLLAACAGPSTPTFDLAGDIPRHYTAPYADEAPVIDGELDDLVWREARWTANFIDIEGEKVKRPRFQTRAKMMWDEENLYIGAWLLEPHVWGTLTEHDSVIFHDNDFEVFLDPDGDAADYFELEINALGTTWDLFLPVAYRDGGRAVDAYEIVGMQSAVAISGTVNDPTDVDRGWWVELALPWEAFAADAGVPCPPREGDAWRINFSRVQWRHEVVDGQYRKVPDVREDNWVWSPQFQVDMHQPEHWGFLHFEGGPPPPVPQRRAR
jgi:hypothetical protein